MYELYIFYSFIWFILYVFIEIDMYCVNCLLCIFLEVDVVVLLDKYVNCVLYLIFFKVFLELL